VDAADVGLVAANLTLTGTEGPMWLTAHAAGSALPPTSNVNADASGRTIAGFSLVAPGANGAISIRPSGRAHVVVDVVGVFLGTPQPREPTLADGGLGIRGSAPISAFDGVIEDFLAATGYPGASVAVARDGRVVYAANRCVSTATSGSPVNRNC
jgi:CubicO group peptidase (beta-lactamase class C family)